MTMGVLSISSENNTISNTQVGSCENICVYMVYF